MPGRILLERTLAWTVLRRALWFWPGVRALLAIPMLLGAPANVDLPAVLLSAEIGPLGVLATASLAVLETRRRHEHLLLANLGIGPVATAALAVVPPAVAEAVLHLLVGP